MIRTFVKELSAVEDLFPFVHLFVQMEEVDDDTAFQLTVAAEELLTNLIKYSAGGNQVTVRLERHEQWCEMQLIDYDAVPFDITTAQLADLDVPIEQRRAGGMGLHLVRSFADELTYRHDNGNSIITFRKKLGLKDVHSSR